MIFVKKDNRKRLLTTAFFMKKLKAGVFNFGIFALKI